MRFSKKITQCVVLLSINLIVGCVQNPPHYATREDCLSQIINQCKASGWVYATTDSTCERVANEGIYGLTPAQLQACHVCHDSSKPKH